MSGKWSGLAPAVDVHLAMWRKADVGMPLVRRAKEGSDKFAAYSEQTLLPALQNDWIHRWMVFASSYGIVNDEGQPMASLSIQDGQTISGREQFKSEDLAIGQGLHLAEREHFMLGHAVTHYVSGEVLSEIDEASALDFEPIFDTDLFVPNGFAVFERPIIFPDLDPDSGHPHSTIKVHVRAIGWKVEDSIWNEKSQAALPGVSVFFYTTSDDYNNGYFRTMVEAGKEPPFTPLQAADGMLQMEVIPWCFGVNWGTRDEVGYRPGTVPMPIAMQRRWFLAFMRLMWQEIIVRHPTHTTRQETRRWYRAKKPVLDYTVLRLRREVDPTYKTPGGGTALDMRIRVRGHWRHQYYPALGEARNADGTMNPESHRLIWIEPFWKGPEDAPLGPLHSATSVVR